nr:putative zinc-binding protein [Candidatus Freyarchaeota archaeon]
MARRVVILPCSGVGKVYGTIAREAAYMTIEQLRPDKTLTVCLPRLVVEDDDDARRIVRENPCIVINGCPSKCAEFAAETAGGKIVGELNVTSVLRENRDLKPSQMAIRELDPKGRRLAEVVAEKVSREVDRILGSEGG